MDPSPGLGDPSSFSSSSQSSYSSFSSFHLLFSASDHLQGAHQLLVPHLQPKQPHCGRTDTSIVDSTASSSRLEAAVDMVTDRLFLCYTKIERYSTYFLGHNNLYHRLGVTESAYRVFSPKYTCEYVLD
ncbi:hypothetical protein Bca4012_008997 [Brassica carinata]